MDAATLQSRLDDVRIVDVRAEREWVEGHIDGALRVPGDDVVERVRELAGPVVVVCRSGERSSEMAEVLRESGVDADSLVGGLEAWVEAGGSLVSSHGHPGGLDGEHHFDDDRAAALEETLMTLMLAVQERFGDREPTEAELRGFLRERLEQQGRSAGEIDAIMRSL